MKTSDKVFIHWKNYFLEDYMKYFRFFAMLLVAATLAITACNLDGGITPNPFDTADTPGDTVSVTAGDVGFDMIYANNQASITIPTGTDDGDTSEITTKFFMGETEVTWELWCEVYIWATGDADMNGSIEGGETDGDYTFQNVGTKGNDGDAGKSSQHPVTDISWRDAVIWCNALSEMTGAEVVYLDNVTDAVLRDSTIAVEDVVTSEADNLTRKGYRLPTSMEWEYAARYQGDEDNGNTVSSYSDPYYTKGNSASGATTYYNDNTGGSGEPGKSANDAVAVYKYYWDGDSWEVRAEYSDGTEEVGGLLANTLGLYDMSGNVWEWCFTASGSGRVERGGSWDSYASNLPVGIENSIIPVNRGYHVGFRFARTQ